MNKIDIDWPLDVKLCYNILKEHDYESYIVGGCVRDSLLGLVPKDWDMCTNATPEQIVDCFKDNFKIIETGIKHGTVTLVMPSMKIEITTYRTESDYEDNRHPTNVNFVSDLFEDLKRRDFTINAMAYNKEVGLVDPYQGQQDLKDRLLRCVGNPVERFNEDGLRILRALRFASIYNLNIEQETNNTIHLYSYLLNNISKERIQEELLKIINSNNLYNIFTEYYDVICTIIPELKPCVYQKQSSSHVFDVYQHMLNSAKVCTEDNVVRLALLLHDIGKPYCKTYENGKVHFKNHDIIGASIVERILWRLRFKRKIITNVVMLIQHHCEYLSNLDKYSILSLLHKYGETFVKQLLLFRKCDIIGKYGYEKELKLKNIYKTEKLLDKLLKSNAIYQLKDLSINGNDVMNILNISQDSKVKEYLELCLDNVMLEKVDNTKEDLTKFLLTLTIK